MKHLFGLLAVLVLVQTAAAQVTVWNRKGIASKTYTNSTIDTTQPRSIAGAPLLAYVVTMRDTGNVTVAFDYRPVADSDTSLPGGGWVEVYSDTMRSRTAGRVKEFLLRTTSIEQITGVGGQIRARHTFSAGTGVTTPTYATKWEYIF